MSLGFALNPHVIGRRQIAAGVTGIYCSRWFHEHDLALLLGEGFVLLAPRNYEHLPGLQVNESIPEVDADLPVENEEHLVSLGVAVRSEERRVGQESSARW